MSRMSTLGTVLVTASLFSATLVGGVSASADEITEPTSDVVIESTPEATAAPDAPADVTETEPTPVEPAAKPAPVEGLAHPGGTAELAEVPWNDTYAHAGIVEGPTVATVVDNTNAGVEKYEKTLFEEASEFRSFNTVWVKWKAPATGAVTVDTFGSVVEDTGLAVYTGSKMSTAKRVAVNDDSASGETRSRITSLAVKAGTWYYFQLGSSGEIETQVTAGLISLNISGNYDAPSNDNQSNAKSMTGSKWSATGTTVGSTIETQWEPTNALASGAPKRVNSIWFKWTALAAGTVSFDSNGSSSRPLYLNAYSSSPSQNIGVVANSAGVNTSGGVSSVLNMPVLAGNTYYFQVGDLSSTAGATQINFYATYTGPVISKLSVTSGKLKGGNYVTITGSRLTNVTKVEFGGNSVVSLKHVGSTKLVVKLAPGSKKGKVAVIAWASGIRSAVVTKSHYTFK